jgi:shikimate O-hydroxycinnamoyltransferase
MSCFVHVQKKTTSIKNQELLQKSPISQIAPSLNVPRIFFYPAEADQEHGHVNINEERSKQLPQSLSEVLTLFYPLAGRYIKDGASIDCNDKGAEYLEVHVNRSLSELLERVDQHEIELLNQLVHLLSDSDDTPLVSTVQFNMFECGGLAIGVGVPHRILDAFSAFAFINAFAGACRSNRD